MSPLCFSGFAASALISYYNLEESLNHSFDEDALARENHTLTSVQLNSKVVSAAISNAVPERLSSPVDFTFSHLQVSPERSGNWDPTGASCPWNRIDHCCCSSRFALLFVKDFK